MQDVNVVVLFHSRGEWIERLALAAAVGAVQGRANIRLRCLAGNAGEAAADTKVDTEYVVPRDSDVEWADAIMTGTLPGADGSADGLERYFDSLSASHGRGKLAGKIGALFTEGSGAASLQSAMQRAGLTIVGMISEPDQLTASRLQGRRVAEAARSLRNRREA
jgi:hypothetical protein